MAINSGLFSSKTDLWATPQKFFNHWNNIYNFQLDACANEENKKCIRYFNEEQNGLVQDWGGGSSLVQSSLWSSNWFLGKKSL